ncbi:hypothetical protein EDC19_0660 [Natranaerovirga hydrolytica]|uniref:Uncharacterized protein n=1 Tax=Natranaerovirga hydrolytica TaxID=680378 RepID=A0A4R1N036_9FIRM|nr:hypothetical protein [Natranaerovirga hydrolytica]TCK98240.1 hypothetical protein EDC19_0660 [Natranaerovirga hydrolytica]
MCYIKKIRVICIIFIIIVSGLVFSKVFDEQIAFYINKPSGRLLAERDLSGEYYNKTETLFFLMDSNNDFKSFKLFQEPQNSKWRTRNILPQETINTQLLINNQAINLKYSIYIYDSFNEILKNQFESNDFFSMTALTGHINYTDVKSITVKTPNGYYEADYINEKNNITYFVITYIDDISEIELNKDTFLIEKNKN